MVSLQSKNEHYTRMQRGQTQFITYYRFLSRSFHHAPAFEGITTRLRSVSGKMHLNSDGHEIFIVHCSTLRTYRNYIALKIFTIIKTQTVRD